MAREFVLKIGNGNDGNYASAIIEMNDDDCPWSFMDVVIANLFISGHRARSHAYKNVMVDGEEEYTIYATLHEGYKGDTEFGAAYKTASLEPHNGDYNDLHKWSVKEWLDRGAMIKYKQLKRKQ